MGSLADSGGCSSPSGSIRPLGRGEGGGERRINTDGASVQHADTCTINKANTDSVSTILPPSFLHTSYVHVCLGDNSVTQMMARCSPNLSQGVRLPPPPPPPPSSLTPLPPSLCVRVKLLKEVVLWLHALSGLALDVRHELAPYLVVPHLLQVAHHLGSGEQDDVTYSETCL